MIDVAVNLNGIHVSGHADIAPRGFDIVCAAVSALTLTLIRGLREIALVEITEEVGQGNICIEWQTINDTGKALIDTWFLGILGIAEQYPVIKLDTDNE